MGEAQIQNGQASMLHPVEKIVMVVALTALAACLVVVYVLHNQKSFHTQASALQKKWHQIQEKGVDTDRLSVLRKRLITLKREHLGPIPSTWFLYLDGVQSQLHQLRVETEKIWSNAVNREKEQALQDHVDSAKKWTTERQNWLRKKRQIRRPKQESKPKVLDVPLINQMAAPKLYNGCEVTSLAMILQYAGYHVTKTELAREIPKVPVSYSNGMKGNPNFGFVGDIDGSTPGYFVYHGPITDLAEKYAGGRVQDLTGDKMTKIYQKLDKGIPVWVITTSTFDRVHNMKTWETPHGKIKVTLSEHSVVLTGHSKKYVWLNNPYGQKNERVNRQAFEQSWIQMGRQAVVINPKMN